MYALLLMLLQVLYSQDEYVTDPILAAVGQLQFEVSEAWQFWATAHQPVIPSVS